MSYFSGAIPFTAGTAGTLQTSTSSSTITAAAHSSTLAGDLLTLAVYSEGDARNAVDNGEGWILAHGGYDSTDNYGLCLFVAISGYAGATRLGLTLPSAMPWTARVQPYRLIHNSLNWDLSNITKGGPPYTATASATTGQRSSFSTGAGLAPQNAQGLQLAVLGYNNGGTTTSSGTITNWAEPYDTGQTSPPHGLVFNHKTGMMTVDEYSLISANLGVAKTERMGLRVFIPIIGNTQQRSRTLDGRRMGS